MADVIRIKRRASGAPGAPTTLASAELAYNEVDHTLYYGEGNSGGNAVTIAAIAGQGLSYASSPAMDGTAAPGSASQWSRGDHVHPSDTSRAPINSPTFTGVPAAPTPANGTNTTQIATTQYVLATRLDQLQPPNTTVSMNSNRLLNVADPTGPQDAATKNYVDITVQGMQSKPTARLATAAALPANTYANGAAGVGATLTATANGALSIDGVATITGGIVLIKNEAAAANNGLYTVTNTGSGSAAYVLTRHVDMDVSAEFPGAFIPVSNVGTTNANTLWLANPSVPVTVGTTPIPFTQLNGATDIIAGNGLSISGNTISAVGTANRIASNPGGIDIASTYVGQTSITTLGTVTTGTWNGTTIAVANGGSGATTLTGYLVGNGTSPFTAVTSIPNTAISGLGTMSTQNANAVAITGGTIDGVTIDGGTF